MTQNVHTCMYVYIFISYIGIECYIGKPIYSKLERQHKILTLNRYERNFHLVIARTLNIQYFRR